MSPVEYLWSVLEDGTIGGADQLDAAEILDAYYGRKRAFGVINDPNRDAVQKIQAWAAQVASSESVPHQLRIRAARLVLSR